MTKSEIKCYEQLSEKQKEEVLEIFIEGFKHLFSFSKNDKELKKTLYTAFHKKQFLGYLEDDTVLGIIGIATNRVRPVKLQLKDCIEVYGKFKGTLYCKQLNAIFQSRVVNGERDLYIDILATKKSARGKGIGTRLLKYAFNLAAYDEYYIEVLSKNENAYRLYCKVGFKEYKKSMFSFITLQGYGYPIKLKLNKEI